MYFVYSEGLEDKESRLRLKIAEFSFNLLKFLLLPCKYAHVQLNYNLNPFHGAKASSIQDEIQPEKKLPPSVALDD